MNEFDLFESQDRCLKTNILKGFKLKQSYEDGGNKVKKYFNEEFKDYFVITISDGFHPEKIELFRKNYKIFDCENSLDFIADVILKDIEKNQPYYVVLKQDNGEKIVLDVFDKRSDDFANGGKKKILEKGYYIKSEKINDNEFKSVFYHIDKDGNPTEKFSQDDYKTLEKKLNLEFEETKKELDKRWNRWRKKYLK